jgi:hypothetical protein
MKDSNNDAPYFHYMLYCHFEKVGCPLILSVKSILNSTLQSLFHIVMCLQLYLVISLLTL